MSGGNALGAELAGERPQWAELEPIVAHHTWVRRAAREILVGKVIDDSIKLALEVQGVERDVEPIGDAARVTGVESGAAAAMTFVRHGRIVVSAGAHEQADDVVTLLLEQHGRDGAIDSARHRQNHALGHSLHPRSSSPSI